jgi:hypothetical protein
MGRRLAIAVGVWVFLTLWILGMSAGMFAGACRKAGLDPEQRLFRCGWSWTLGTVFRTLGDPPQKYAWLKARIGIAEAELGDTEAAAQSFTDAIGLAKLADPQGSPLHPKTATGPMQAIAEQFDALPPTHPARALFQGAWEEMPP